MDFVLAIAENEVPSTKESDPYMHVFLDAGQDNVLAFFELPTKPKMGKDQNRLCGPFWGRGCWLALSLFYFIKKKQL